MVWYPVIIYAYNQSFLFFFNFVIRAYNDNVICKKIELRAVSLQVQTGLDSI